MLGWRLEVKRRGRRTTACSGRRRTPPLMLSVRCQTGDRICHRLAYRCSFSSSPRNFGRMHRPTTRAKGGTSVEPMVGLGDYDCSPHALRSGRGGATATRPPIASGFSLRGHCPSLNPPLRAKTLAATGLARAAAAPAAWLFSMVVTPDNDTLANASELAHAQATGTWQVYMNSLDRSPQPRPRPGPAGNGHHFDLRGEHRWPPHTLVARKALPPDPNGGLRLRRRVKIS